MKPSSKGQNKLPAIRIIGGAMRGRPIHYDGDPATRPMKDRVREAAFNLLGPPVKGKPVIDLFAGTGAMAFEAISRGASNAILIERRFPNARLIRETAAELKIEAKIDVFSGDTFNWVHRVSVGGPPQPCNLPGEEMEPGLDWNRWLGPAPMREYSSVLSPRVVLATSGCSGSMDHQVALT